MKENNKENNKENTPFVDAVELNIDSTGPHYEHISEFQTSLFKSVYKRAFLQVDEIIGNFKQDSSNGTGSYSFSRYADSSSGVGKGLGRFCNIITFAGKRGAGKTSAMLSFMDALKHYYGNREMYGKGLFYTFKKMENPLFTCLDCIDGSLLEHEEDIFKVVLAQIYQKFMDLDEEGGIAKGEDFAVRKRELLKKLEEIYGTVCDIENMENGQRTSLESHMSSLQSLSSSQKVKKDFEKLIEKFTFLMKYERRGMTEVSRQHYVVIAIDDIDLNIDHGFSMLEKIHRYCMVENVIVLLSVDIEQMLSIVSRNFYEVLPKVDEVLCAGKKMVHELATDYLGKVMPVNYRIYVPNLSNYYSANGLVLPKEKSGIKQSVFLKLYRRIGICFDSQGLKQHFYEPKSMRQLTCFYLMLEALEYIGMGDVYFGRDMQEEDLKNLVRVWNENYRILTDELFNRIVLEKIHVDREADEFCKLIEKQDIRRAKDEVVNFYKKIKANLFWKENMGEDIERGVYVENCSYGQLVETVYELGRIESGKYKPLVHYLLGYFSYTFTRLYIYEKLTVKNAGKPLAKGEEFKSLIGGNIVDDWSMQLMPNIIKKRNTDVDEQGIASGDKSNKLLEYFSNYKGITLSNILHAQLKDKEEIESEEERCRYAAKLIRNMELLFLFFTNIREDGQKGIVTINSESFEWKFEINLEKEGGEWIEFQPQIDGLSSLTFVGDYSVLNFVGNSLDAVQILEKFEEGLIVCLAEYYELMESGSSKLKECFQKEIKKYSLKVGFKAWERKFGEFSLPLPLFWFDLTYNILKRVKRDMNEKFIVSHKSEDMFSCIQKLYENIAGQLTEQEEFYAYQEKGNQIQDRSAYDYKLVERFRECPIVDYFLGTGNVKGKRDEKKKEIEERREFIQKLLKDLKKFNGE
ncbi:MAG: hypothetical protein HFI70_02715 [Lachnospiraceae bacterium]|nr:hypothetical protein [Lachnospiraceae bacterium]